MKLLNKTLLLSYIFSNLGMSLFFVLLQWYTARFLEGPLHYVNLLLYLPSFYILVLIKGVNETLHFTTYRTELIVSYTFYAFVIAIFQMIIYIMRRSPSKK